MEPVVSHLAVCAGQEIRARSLASNLIDWVSCNERIGVVNDYFSKHLVASAPAICVHELLRYLIHGLNPLLLDECNANLFPISAGSRFISCQSAGDDVGPAVLPS